MNKRAFLLAVYALLLSVACFTWRTPIASAETPVPKGRHYPHIRTFSTLYISRADPRWAAVEPWAREHIDLSIVSPGAELPKVTPSQVAYLNFSDLPEHHPFYDLANNSVPTSDRFDDMFYHYNQDKVLTVRANQSQKEDRLQAVLQAHQSAAGDDFKDVTEEAFGDTKASVSSAVPVTSELVVAASTGDAFYAGFPWPYREFNINIVHPATPGWRGLLEYWDGKEWKSLTLASDETKGLTRLGRIRFNPPMAWQRSTIKGRELYWLRWRCVATPSGISGPVLRSVEEFADAYHWSGVSAISGEKYARTGLPNQWVLPGWDPANDPNHDGFVDDLEFAHRINPQASARFRWQSRLPAAYFSGRWQTNLANADYLRIIKDQVASTLKALPNYNGLFIDNSNNVMHDVFTGRGSYAELPGLPPDQSAIHRAYLKIVRDTINARALSPDQRQLWINATPDHFLDPSVNGMMWEMALGWIVSPKENADFLTRFSNDLEESCKNRQSILVMGRPDFRMSAVTPVPIETDELYVLARYYLTADACSYFSYADEGAHGTPWNSWFPAIETDIGQPEGNWFSAHNMVAEGSSPQNIFGRRFSKALVLLRTRYQENSTPARLHLPEKYFPLAADGSWRPKTNSVALQNYEGLILLKSCGESPCVGIKSPK